MTSTTTNANATKVNNGVNVDALLGAREALEQGSRGGSVQVASERAIG